MKKKSKKPFGVEEFVDSLWKIMKKQEKKNPHVALLHNKLKGDFLLIGLTGGIATGKTMISQFFKKAGIPVIDADEIAREIVRHGKKAYQEIKKSFGKDILLPNGEIDRKKLAVIIFADPSKKALLESITHPKILNEIQKRIVQLKKKKHTHALIEAALLFESGLDRMMHKIILINAHPDVQLKRLMERDQLSAEEASQRILSQMPQAEKEKLAHFIIDNSGTIEAAQEEALRLIKALF